MLPLKTPVSLIERRVMKVYTLKQRKELCEQLPWVTKLPVGRVPTRCEGIKWGTVALHDIFEINGKPPRGYQERSKCKRMAHWKFRSLKKSWATDGKYCWSHLSQQLTEESERMRYMKYLERKGLV